MVKDGAINMIILRLDPNYKTRNFLSEYSSDFTINNLEDTTKLTWFLLDGIKHFPKDHYPMITQEAWK